MSTRSTVSERFLAEVIGRRLSGKISARVLVGGLGFGFTVKALVESSEAPLKIRVAELLPEVVEWNRKYLAEFNGGIVDHPRVEIRTEDVWDSLGLEEGEPHYDAILMDVDNGAAPLVQDRNRRLYGSRGLRRIATALTERGYAAFWSASPDPAFQRRLSGMGFLVEEIPVRAHERARRSAHVVYLARRGQLPKPPTASTGGARENRFQRGKGKSWGRR